MEAARIATLRGHRVTLFEKSAELGGAILYCCSVPGKQKMRWYADWLRHQIQKLDVEVRLGLEPLISDLKSFDAVILATGGRVRRPSITGIDGERVLTFEDVLRCSLDSCKFHPEGRFGPAATGPTVLIWGDHFAAADAAEKLASEGRKVYVVTQDSEFARWMEPCHRDVLLKRLAGGNGEGLNDKPFAQPVTVIPSTTVLEISPAGEVALMNQRFETSRLTVDQVILADVEPASSPYLDLVEAGVPVTRIGDLKGVRNLRAAVSEGANAGLTLDDGLRMNANGEMISLHPTEVDLPNLLGKRMGVAPVNQ